MKRLVIENSDGTLAIEIPAPNAVKELGLSSIDELLDYLEARRIQEGKNVVGRIDDHELPNASTVVEDWFEEDGVAVWKPVDDNIRHFRNQWRWDGSKIVEEPIEVKNKRAENARAVRNKLLEQSDVEMMVANERANPNVGALKTYRQNLRDMGPDIDSDPVNIVWPIKPV